MKNKIWLLQIPFVLLFTGAFLIVEQGELGNLKNAFLRDQIFPMLRAFSGSFTNLKFNIRGPRKPRSKIVIVEIDNESLDRDDGRGRWPWHRDDQAFLIARILGAGAKVVALDWVDSEPDRRIPDDLRELLEKDDDFRGKVDRFETDPVLTHVIEGNRDRLVLGYAIETFCQPAYDSQCSELIQDPDLLALRPPGMEKFAIQKEKKPPGFDVRTTPLLSVFLFLHNIDEYTAAASHAGYFNAHPDTDGYIRRSALIHLAEGRAYPSLALEAARVAMDEELFVEFDDEHKVSKLGFAKSGREIPVNPLGSMEINFRGPSRTFTYLSALDVLGRSDEDARMPASERNAVLKDAVVFVGLTALAAHDMRAFPFDSNTPGVEGHATIADNLMAGDMVVPSAIGGKTAWMLVLMIAGALAFAYAAQRLEALPELMLFIVVVGGVGFIDIRILFENNVNWNTSMLYVEVFAIFLFTLAVKYVLEERNRKFIRGAFSKYVAPTIVDSILKDPTKLTVGGEKKDLTILFSDIRGFTTLSERMEPKALSKFLNDYLGSMTDIVFEYEGTLDKYIGDAIMAFWGAPLDQAKHAANACRAAVKMLQELEKQSGRFRSDYGVDVNIGIGINSGPVSVGNMGSERIFEYTVIGDHVNLASRLEGLTKYYGARIVTTRFTLDAIRGSGDPVPAHRVLDSVKVKGKDHAVELIHILEWDAPAEGLRLFEEGRRLYTARKWDEAIRVFEEANALLRRNIDEEDGPSRLYQERCETFKQTPPDADWDGSWKMTSK